MGIVQDSTSTTPVGLNPKYRLLVAALVLLIIPTFIGIWSAGHNVHDIDINISRSLQRWQGSVPDLLQRVADPTGDTLGAILGFVILAIIAWKLNGASEVKFVIIAAGFRAGGMLLKGVFNSPRPTEDFVALLREYENTGYPSGHSMTAAMLSTTLVVIIWRRFDRAEVRLPVTIVAALFTLTVGWSRIWAGAHWPTDVIGGWMYGVGFVLLAAWIVYRPRGSSQAATEAGS